MEGEGKSGRVEVGVDVTVESEDSVSEVQEGRRM